MPSFRARNSANFLSQEVKGRAYLYSNPSKSTPVELAIEVPQSRRRSNGLTGPGHYITRLHYIHVEPIFTENCTIVHDCVVTSGTRRFLVCAYYEPTSAVNEALASEFFGFEWRGELVIAELGRKTVLSFVNLRPFHRQVLKEVVNRFLAEALMALHAEKDIPKRMSIT
ncbi:hypothetical protein FB45DRAFT_1023078 [Roridomyces roridus]|uniref:Uncharacterized protein n=1 Tax=Roridomyces roridus TaxID=1738132 RepID=A0AAD7C3K9_9AGAR|nr:hypothetical protein FB45DRAFT_1023078 [Roridomyces roridus]